MFLVVNEPVTTSEKLNKDIDNIGQRASYWKMSFNLGPSKEAQELIFLSKIIKVHHQSLLLNNSAVKISIKNTRDIS